MILLLDIELYFCVLVFLLYYSAILQIFKLHFQMVLSDLPLIHINDLGECWVLFDYVITANPATYSVTLFVFSEIQYCQLYDYHYTESWSK